MFFAFHILVLTISFGKVTSDPRRENNKDIAISKGNVLIPSFRGNVKYLRVSDLKPFCIQGNVERDLLFLHSLEYKMARVYLNPYRKFISYSKNRLRRYILILLLRLSWT